MRAVVHRKANDVDVLLQGHGRDRLRSLAQAAVDDLEAGVTQDPGDNLDAPVVPVEPDLGHQDPELTPPRAQSTCRRPTPTPW